MFDHFFTITMSSSKSDSMSSAEFWGILINCGLLATTFLYTSATFWLLLTTIRNHREMLKNQLNERNDSKYFQYRRIWNGETMIEARNRGNRTLREAQKAGATNIYQWLTDSRKFDEWIDLSLVTHFMADIFIEYEAGVITSTQLLEGFPEFEMWTRKMIPIYGSMDDETRVTNQLQWLACEISNAKRNEKKTTAGNLASL